MVIFFIPKSTHRLSLNFFQRPGSYILFVSKEINQNKYYYSFQEGTQKYWKESGRFQNIYEMGGQGYFLLILPLLMDIE